MRQKAWWSVKMYWALSQRVWTAARLATAVSPDNSGYQEPARTCGEVLGRATSLLTAADWPLGQSRAAGCSHIHHLHTCTTLLHAHWGRHYFFHFTPRYFSCQIKKWHEKNNNSGAWAEQQQHSRKVILPMKIGLASTQSISHQRGYCYVCFYSKGGWSLN